ncbi:MAG TPA: hypothetical protein VFN55_09735 [Solirubrobacteraceae bacterium]|nr:hypothetical protein [Solirubrobacteraceae bacterium]
MADGGFPALRRALGGSAPEGLRALADDDLDHLAAAILDARRRQGRALAEAGERSLSHIPRLLRGPIRKLVG